MQDLAEAREGRQPSLWGRKKVLGPFQAAIYSVLPAGFEVEQEIDPEFSFAGRSAIKRQSDIDEDIEKALHHHCDESDVLWRGLKRGIGVSNRLNDFSLAWLSCVGC